MVFRYGGYNMKPVKRVFVPLRKGICTVLMSCLTLAWAQNDLTRDGGKMIDEYQSSPIAETVEKLIDDQTSTKFLTFHDTVWIEYQANQSYTLQQYSITSANDFSDRDPYTWKLMGSNNRTTWDILDEKTAEIFTSRLQKKIYPITNTKTHIFYRFNIRCKTGATTQFSELELIGTAVESGAAATPTTPTNFKVLQATSNSIQLEWGDASNNERAFRLERSSDGMTWTMVNMIGANATTYTDTDLYPVTSYFYRLRAENSKGNSTYTSTVTIKTLSPPPPSETWQEHWLEHVQLLKRVNYSDDAAIYYDDDMVKTNVTWIYKFTADVWAYTKKTYGPYGNDPRLFAVFHQGKYGGGHPSTYFDAGHDYHNVIDIGGSNWIKAEGWNIDVIVHEISHIVEGSTNAVASSPAFGIWGDSKWAEIFIYDVYKGLGMEKEAQIAYNNVINGSDKFPKEGTAWFKNWFYPIYRDYGQTQVLVNFFKVMAMYYPKNGYRYAKDMNFGEFVWFWSGAAKTDLKQLATNAFGWPAEYEAQYNAAKAAYPDVIKGVPVVALQPSTSPIKIQTSFRPQLRFNSSGRIEIVRPTASVAPTKQMHKFTIEGKIK